jgi:hypothetical protein
VPTKSDGGRNNLVATVIGMRPVAKRVNDVEGLPKRNMLSPRYRIIFA